MPYRVKEVSELAGVSVRTLHHYDEIGLLRPEAVSPAGYRLYSDRDLERLQQILFFKEIGFGLEDIKRVLESPGFDRKEALLAHRELLLEKKKRLDDIIRTVDRTIESIEGGIPMSKQDMFDGFDMDAIREHQQKYAEEARQKYGKSALEATEKRVAGYGEAEWKAIMEDAARIYRSLAAVMPLGPDSDEAQAGVSEWRAHITRNYYDCTPEIFRGLGEMYVADERFTANIDKHGAGLAAFMRDAMTIYCDRLGNGKA